jgi:hypothetical protein
MNPVKIASAIATFAVALSLSVQAQIVASDNAGNYSSWGSNLGSTTQASQGTGFGSWTIGNTAGGNGGENGSFLGGSAQVSQPQNINSGNGNSFGLYANSGQTASAIAPFQEGNLQAYQTFSIELQNNDIQTGGTVGFGLQNSSGQNVFEFYFVGGGSFYDINVWQNAITGNQIASTVGYTSGPMTLDFNLFSGNSWAFSIYEGATLEQTLTSTADGNLWSSVSQARVFNANSGSGSPNNFYFNDVQIVPEPATLALFGISGLTLLAFRRRK